MENYEKLLDKAYNEVRLVSHTGERFEIPKVQGRIEGKYTIITNFKTIADYLRRPPANLAKFLQKELAAQGKIDGDRLMLKAKLNSAKVNEKIQMYAKEFVICPICKKPDTEIISEKGVKLRHCLACGAKSPIHYNL